MNTAEILRAAAGRVRQGWCQDVMRSIERVCTIGAIGAVTGTSGAADSVFLAQSETLLYLQRALVLRDLVTKFAWFRCTGAIGLWNDATDQTAENVAAGLEYAALLWEQEQATLVNAGATPMAARPGVGAHDSSSHGLTPAQAAGFQRPEAD